MAITRRQAGIIFFIFTVVVSVFLFVWMVFINRGTLIMHGEPLYFLEVPGVGEKLCEDENCKMSIAPGEYAVTVSKRGYYDETLDIEIKRWQEAEFSVAFQYIPNIVESNAKVPYVFPEGYEEFLTETDSINLSAFSETQKDLTDLPASPKAVSFSPNGSYLYIEARNQTVFDLKNDTEQEVDIPEDVEPFWSPDEKKFVYLDINKENQKQTLYQFDVKKNKDEIVTAFLRDFEEYKVYFANDSNKLIVVDLESSPNEVFLVDLNEKSKQVLFVVPGFQELKWSKSGNYFVYSNVVGSTFSTNLYDLPGDESSPVFVNFDLDKVDFTSNDDLIFISNASAEEPIEVEEVSIGFEEALDLFDEVLSEEEAATPEEEEAEEVEVAPAEPVYFINFDRENTEYTDISSISADQRIVVDRIEMKGDDSGVLFWTGVNMYEIRLSE